MDMKLTENETLDLIVRRMQSDKAVDAPSGLLKYVKDLYRVRAVEPKTSIIRRIVAVMTADLAPGVAAFGERSTGEGKARQMLFDSGENAIDIRIKQAGSGFSLDGQVLGFGFENGKAELIGETFSADSDIDGDSEFRFESIPSGNYSLVIRGTAEEIAIEALTIS